MIKGKTKSGFNFKVDKEVLEKWSTMRLLSKVEKNATAMVELLETVLGEEQTDALIEHLGGDPTTSEVANELTNIFESIKESNSKNS